jgi:hypothetical protein
MSIEVDQLAALGIHLTADLVPVTYEVTRDYNMEKIHLTLMRIKLVPQPCPFCDAEELIVHGGLKPRVQCQSCDAEGPVSNTKHAAIEKWNEA